jgi:hypothetical protein
MQFMQKQGQHQAQGLQSLFSNHGPRLVSVLAAPSAPASHEFILALAAELARKTGRVWLVETETNKLSGRLGCRPLLPWQASRPLDLQVISAGSYGLLNAPGCSVGDKVFASAAAACRDCDFLLFDAGRFSSTEVPIDATTAQTLIILLGKQDAETGYALVKALTASRSPARVLLIGEVADQVAQAAKYFSNQSLESLGTGVGLSQIDNKIQETSSNTLTFAPNLRWVVSRITQTDQLKVAHGGLGKGAEEAN